MKKKNGMMEFRLKFEGTTILDETTGDFDEITKSLNEAKKKLR